MLLGPVGCLLRWRLSPLNYSLPGRARFLPAGTLAANCLGCAASFMCASLLDRVGPGPWGGVALRAVQVGFAGALSTVSTLTAEAASQLRRVPADTTGFLYLAITWLASLAIGVVAYGPAVWTR